MKLRIEYGTGNELSTETSRPFREIVERSRTVGDVCHDEFVQAALGFGTNVRPHIGSVPQADSTLLFDGMTINMHEVACSKA